ncbi:hypothetical protein LCGC14_0390480 [marine sediment metagenome]|uniref:O-antigen ligase-related domain-containing protein n=1 Tax=marine sediment metagenome TaxID=412755 RepID=A0A0F9W8P2_9ZZZZ
MDILKKTTEYTLIAGLVLCATLYSTETLVKRVPARDIAWCLTAIVLVLTIRRIDFSVLKQWIFPAFAGYLIVTLISGYFAANFGEWYYDCSRTSLMMVYLFLAVSVIDKDIAKPIIILAIGLGVYGLMFWPVATMGNKNFWGQANFLMLVLCVYSIFHYKGFWQQIGLAGGWLAFANILVSRPKSVWLACIVFVLAVSVFYRKAFLIAVVLTVVVGGVFLIFPEKVGLPSSLTIRLEQWRETLRMTEDNFMVGAGNWKIAVNDYAYNLKASPEAGMTQFFKSPHNDYLWVLAEKSIFGLFFYIAIFALGLFYAYKSRNVFIFAGLAGYMTIAFFSFPQERPFPSMFLVLLLALAVKGYHIKSKFRFPRPVFYIVALSILGAGMVSFHARYVGQVNYRRARFETTYPRAIERLSNISVFSTLDHYTTPYYWLRASLQAKAGNKEESLKDYKLAVEANPGNIYAQSSLGLALYQDGQVNEAIECYEKALAIRPDFEIAKSNIAMIKKGL